MRYLNSGMPATRARNWCDCGNAQISWARHTSHSGHPISIARTNTMPLFLPERADAGGHRAARVGRICRDTGGRGDTARKSGGLRCDPSEPAACHLAPSWTRCTARSVGSPQEAISATGRRACQPNEIAGWALGREQARATGRWVSRGAACLRGVQRRAHFRDDEAIVKTARVYVRATVITGLCGRDV